MMIKAKLLDYNGTLDVYIDSNSIEITKTKDLVLYYLSAECYTCETKKSYSIGRHPIANYLIYPDSCMIPVKYTGAFSNIPLYEKVYMDFSTVKCYNEEIFISVYEDKDRTRQIAEMRIQDFEELEEDKEMGYFIINELRFVKTSIACPEQYDVFINGTVSRLAYVRLRGGILMCRFPDVLGDLIFEYDFSEPLMGTFRNEEERKLFLTKISECIKKEYEELSNISKFEPEHEEEWCLTAQQAYERTKALKDDKYTEELKDIMAQIHKTIDDEHNFSIEIAGSIMPEVIEKLIALDYKVTSIPLANKYLVEWDKSVK